MKVREIMTIDVGSCGLETNLAAAARIMWDKDCGSVPVLDSEGRAIGLITDRDICMALATRNNLASELTVGDVVGGALTSCAPEDDVSVALRKMQDEQLRRLPVVDGEGKLVGILSLNDVILHSKRGKSKKGAHVSHGEVMNTLKALSQHRTPTLDSLV
ncbi:MAG: CBS domain-containing protein [Pyrinomonadaceae bacterium]|nr:CBS domain-containing protein [Pyrinomonadaceae bacterium]